MRITRRRWVAFAAATIFAASLPSVGVAYALTGEECELYREMIYAFKLFPEKADNAVEENRHRIKDEHIEFFEEQAAYWKNNRVRLAKEQCQHLGEKINVGGKMVDCQKNFEEQMLHNAAEKEDIASVLRGEKDWLETASGQMWMKIREAEASRTGEERYKELHGRDELKKGFRCP